MKRDLHHFPNNKSPNGLYQMSSLVFKNGLLSTPTPVSTLLEANPGAYTTTRTHNNGSEVLFWERHLSRLTNSVNILLDSKPEFFFRPKRNMAEYDKFLGKSTMWDSLVRALVNDSMRKALPRALEMRKCGEEIAITALVSGNLDKLGRIESADEDTILKILDIYLHFGSYIPLELGVQRREARLAVVGYGRDIAGAKYSDWARQAEEASG